MTQEDCECLTCLHADITYGDQSAAIFCILKDKEIYTQEECQEFTPIIGEEKGEGDGTAI